MVSVAIHFFKLFPLISSLCTEATLDPSTLRRTFTPKEGGRVPMGDVFTSCNWMLRDGFVSSRTRYVFAQTYLLLPYVEPPKSASQTSAKRLFLITDEDNPHPGNAQLLKTATNTLVDLKQLGVVIQTFFISSHDKPFKQAKFWAVSFDISCRERRI
jgi:ATP-dependent DNA helicase 2 subunit 1